DDPDDFHRHWTLIYEMGRVHPGPWHFRATWPPYTFMNAHFQTAIVLHELGGAEAMKVPNPYNGLAYQMNIDGLRFWEKSDKKFAETFQPDFADRGFAFEDGDKKVHLWGGTININILFHIYLEDGFEKVVEVLQNMAQKQRLVSTAEQAGLDLSEAINEATDGKYAKKLIEEWGMPDPADYAFRTLGRDTGKLVEKDEYLWDFIPFNSDDVAEGYSPLTEKSTKGYVRWASAPDWATRSHNDSTPARDQTVVGVGYNGVDLDGPNTYADYRRYVDRSPEPSLKETRAIGKLNAEESDNAKDNYIARWTGRVQVPMSGSYKFALEPDDWAMLVIDGDLVGVSRNRRTEFTLELERGDHEFELAFGELGGAARLSFDFDSKLKFTGAPGERLPSYERYDNANLEGGQPVAKGTFTLHHELRPAVWQVTVGFSNLAETHGVGIAAEGKEAKTGIVLPQNKLHEETFEVEVRDGTLDLSFWNESSAFNSVGLSSLRIKRLRDLPK
ncbi:MAG: PA14 domain-containing protein, partial [Verrucomicrobiota bacterium]